MPPPSGQTTGLTTRIGDKTTIDNTKNDKGQIQQALCRILITLYAPRRHVISYEKDSYNSMREYKIIWNYLII